MIARPPGLREQVPLAPRTTLEVGGAARFFLEARDEAEVLGALAWAREEGLAVTVLGGGSNVLVADRGVAGLVLQPAMRGVQVTREGERVRVRAAAGEPWDALVARAVGGGWAGLECLSGIPGAVGATPIQNVGAYGQEVADTIAGVTAIDRMTGEVVELAAAELGFGYRDSVFKRGAAGRYVVCAVTFVLHRGGPPRVRYAELARRLAQQGEQAEPTLTAVRHAVLSLRRDKSMVLDPADENRRSAGSFFMNPTLAPEEAAHVRAQAAHVLAPGEAMPEHAAAGGRVKLSAAWLIERAGLAKGTGDGRVGLSTRHTLAIVNRGGATAGEVVAFAQRVRSCVRDRFGVRLTPEPVALGWLPDEADFE